jgi:hypothetical protein
MDKLELRSIELSQCLFESKSCSQSNRRVERQERNNQFDGKSGLLFDLTLQRNKRLHN